MKILKSSTSLTLVIAVLIGFFLFKDGILPAVEAEQVTESKVEQSPQGKESKNATIKLQEKAWCGSISENETKQLELNVLFPHEGKFFMEIIAAAYDRQWKIWKILGEYFAYVTTKRGEEGRLEKTRTRPKVLGQKVKAEGPVTYNPTELAKKDTLGDKNAKEKPEAIPNPPAGWPLRQSMRAGEAPLELLVSFEPNPKIDEPTKLLLRVSSTVPRDSVVVELLIPDSIKVIR